MAPTQTPQGRADRQLLSARLDQRPTGLRPPLPDMQLGVALDDPVDVLREGFRTHTGQGLSLLPLPIGLPEHGGNRRTTETPTAANPPRRTRTCRLAFAGYGFRSAIRGLRDARRGQHYEQRIAHNSSRPCRIAASVSRNLGIPLYCNILRWLNEPDTGCSGPITVAPRPSRRSCQSSRCAHALASAGWPGRSRGSPRARRLVGAGLA